MGAEKLFSGSGRTKGNIRGEVLVSSANLTEYALSLNMELGLLTPAGETSRSVSRGTCGVDGKGLIANETPVLMNSLTPGGLGIDTLTVIAVDGRQGAQP